MSTDVRKPRRMKPHSRQWEKMADKTARSWSPPIHPCSDCGAPVITGYCCRHCGSTDPRRKERENA